jgi:hypothetical protein
MNRAPTWLAALLALLGAAPAGAAPAPGSYAARLCVTRAADAAPSCGPAQVQWSGSRLQLRVSDIVYRLTLQPRRERGRLDMMLMHGTMQIDAFSADYEWVGGALRFEEAEKQSRYEVQLGERRRGAR